VQTYAGRRSFIFPSRNSARSGLARDRRHWRAIENKSARMLPRLS